MEPLVQKIEQINGVVNGFAWGPIMLVLLVGTGVYLSIRTGFIQVRRFGFAMRNTVGTLFRKTDKDHGNNLSPFQAMTTALAGTVGTGNIAGVTGAIFTGGPGAVFWMWVSAFFGMCTKYAEITLAVKYRNVEPDGTHHGGPCIPLKRASARTSSGWPSSSPSWAALPASASATCPRAARSAAPC